MKKVWSKYVSIVPRKFSNIGQISRFYSWKLSRSSSECLDHISQIKRMTWFLNHKKLKTYGYIEFEDHFI